MGEESIAQKPRTRRQGTVEDGRKRKRRAGEKEALMCTQESGQSGCKIKEEKSQQEETGDPRGRGGKKVKAV